MLRSLIIFAVVFPAGAQIHMWAGNTQITDAQGTVWMPNTCTGTALYTNPGTYPSPIYNQAAYTAAAGTPITCTFQLTPGLYTLLFHLIEPIFNTAQRRVFSVYANGSPVLTGVDIYQRAGGAEYPYDVQGAIPTGPTGTNASPGITITFTQVKSSAIFSGIEIIPVSLLGQGLTYAGAALSVDFSMVPGLKLTNAYGNMGDYSLGQMKLPGSTGTTQPPCQIEGQPWYTPGVSAGAPEASRPTEFFRSARISPEQCNGSLMPQLQPQLSPHTSARALAAELMRPLPLCTPAPP